jgi:hypothetical protein
MRERTTWRNTSSKAWLGRGLGIVSSSATNSATTFLAQLIDGRIAVLFDIGWSRIFLNSASDALR